MKSVALILSHNSSLIDIGLTIVALSCTVAIPTMKVQLDVVYHNSGSDICGSVTGSSDIVSDNSGTNRHDSHNYSLIQSENPGCNNCNPFM